MSAKPKPAPQIGPDWKSAFQGQVMKSSFCLALTQPMLEFLCATADGVAWDRRLYTASYGIAKPDNWLASSGALIKRGLVVRLARHELIQLTEPFEEVLASSHYALTPAGVALVELLKVAGIFVEADAAIVRKLRSRKP